MQGAFALVGKGEDEGGLRRPTSDLWGGVPALDLLGEGREGRERETVFKSPASDLREVGGRDDRCWTCGREGGRGGGGGFDF
ncbi:hypothetical protein TIFTF001_017234 [Ficus carica]|uniref:Uncharacterized protein n=1 Tax=Ficus carica TaxID=3494 RepID=A0AA88AKV0_FICCA|nr:hypothetical protein TIFTF001_017234 [Ficus carica]